MGYNTSNPPIVENTTQSNTENLQTQNLQLNKLLEDRNKKAQKSKGPKKPKKALL